MLEKLHSEKLDDYMIPCWAGMLHMVKLQVHKAVSYTHLPLPTKA